MFLAGRKKILITKFRGNLYKVQILEKQTKQRGRFFQICVAFSEYLKFMQCSDYGLGLTIQNFFVEHKIINSKWLKPKSIFV
jgi:hypothetical protein